jgi:hypothetical protein
VPTAPFQGGCFDALGRRYATPRVLMPYGNSAKASLNGWGRRPTSAPRQAEPLCKRASTSGRRPCCSRQRLGPLPTATRQRLYPANPGRLPCCSPMVNGWGRCLLQPGSVLVQRRMYIPRKNGVLNVRISIGACRLIEEHAPLRPPDKNRAAERYTVPGPRDSFTLWRRQRQLAFLFSAGSH